jgi:hypothetical protein
MPKAATTNMASIRRKIRFFIKSIFCLIREQKLVFGLGVCIGVTLAILVHFMKNPDHVLSHFHLVGLSAVPFNHLNVQKTISYLEAKYDFSYEKWLSRSFDGAKSVQIDPDLRRYSVNHTDIPSQFLNLFEKDLNNNNENDNKSVSQVIDNYVNEKELFDPRTEAYFLSRTIPVVCIVYPTDLDWARTVRETWGRHCTELRFFSHKTENSSLGIELVKSTNEFSLVCQSLQKIYFENERKSSQSKRDNFWVMVSTQDTYVLLENFRFYVAPLNQSGEYYLGHAMKFWNSVYNW